MKLIIHGSTYHNPQYYAGDYAAYSFGVPTEYLLYKETIILHRATDQFPVITCVTSYDNRISQ